MIVLDASVLIALLRRADTHHHRAAEIAGAGGGFAVHPVNLAEALVDPVREGREVEAMAAWRSIGVRSWSSGDEAPVDLARLRVATRLRMPGCCVLLVAESLGVPIATFDARLAGTARDRGIEVLGAGG